MALFYENNDKSSMFEIFHANKRLKNSIFRKCLGRFVKCNVSRRNGIKNELIPYLYDGKDALPHTLSCSQTH